MKVKRMVTIFAAFCMASSLFACANKGATNTTSPAPTTGANATSSPAANKKITITYMDGTWNSPVPDPKGAGLLAINEKFNVDFQTQFVSYDDYADKLPVVVAGGSMPDMIGSEGADSNFLKWAGQGAFLPLNDYIDQYPSLKAVPQYVWDQVTVDGKIYAIPQYYPTKYGKKPIIRADWLKNVGLSMPTNYEELKAAAIAFTNNDPDKNNKKDTYGLGLAKGVVYGAWMGAAWDTGWYNKNAEGQYIPGYISDPYKQSVQLMHDLFKAGAINPDWAVTTSSNARKDFFAGKMGIFYEQPYDFGEARFKALKELQPSADLQIIPAFKQDDGQQGFMSLGGFYQMVMLNAKLKNDPDKVKRILDIEEYFRTFIPTDQRKADNPDFDWQNGGEGKGYNVENGVAVMISGAEDIRPNTYVTNRGWAPNNEANDIASVISDPFPKAFATSAAEMFKNAKFYFDPTMRVHSEVWNRNADALLDISNTHVTKMINGQESISNWDKYVQEYLNKGGKESVEDVNKLLKDRNIKGEWQ